MKTTATPPAEEEPAPERKTEPRQEPEPTEAPQPEIKAYSGRGDDVIKFKRAVTQPTVVTS